MKTKFHLEIVLLGIVSIISLVSVLGAHSFEASAAVNTINGDASSAQNIIRQAGNTTVTNSTGTVKIGIGPNVIVINKNQTYTAGAKQTFGPSSAFAGLNIGILGADPTSLTNGDLWIMGPTSNVFKYRDSIGVTRTLVAANTIQTLLNKKIQDTTNGFINTADPTKQAKFDVSTISPAHTDTWTFPNANSTFVGTNLTQTITGPTTMNSLILGGSENASNNRITNLGTPTVKTDAQVSNHLGLLGNLVTVACGDQQVIRYQNSNQTWICSTLSYLTNAITSINGQTGPGVNIVRQSGNTTMTNSTNQIKVGLGPNVVITNGAAQTISKQMTFSNAATFNGGISVSGGSGIQFTDPSGTLEKITAGSNDICIGSC